MVSRVTTALHFNGRSYAPGEPIALDDALLAELVERGLIELVDENVLPLPEDVERATNLVRGCAGRRLAFRPRVEEVS